MTQDDDTIGSSMCKATEVSLPVDPMAATSELTYVVLDLSSGGASLQVDRPDDVPDVFLLRAPDHNLMRLAQVRWREANRVGVAFVGRRTVGCWMGDLAAEISTLQARLNELKNLAECQDLFPPPLREIVAE